MPTGRWNGHILPPQPPAIIKKETRREMVNTTQHAQGKPEIICFGRDEAISSSNNVAQTGNIQRANVNHAAIWMYLPTLAT